MSFDFTELSREKTLWQARLAARKIPSSRFNIGMVIGACAAATVYAFFTRSSTSSLAQRTRELSDLGFNFTVGILGFLIAGFTVFATITKEDLFRVMATIPHKKSGLSTLKYNLFAFMRVFFDYLCFASFCLSIKIAASPGGPMAELLSLLPTPEDAKNPLAKIGFVVMTTFLVYVLVILKSFVFNIYNFVITTIQYSFILRAPDEDGLEAGDPPESLSIRSVAHKDT